MWTQSPAIASTSPLHLYEVFLASQWVLPVDPRQPDFVPVEDVISKSDAVAELFAIDSD
jgi:hypothetical protein